MTPPKTKNYPRFSDGSRLLKYQWITWEDPTHGSCRGLVTETSQNGSFKILVLATKDFNPMFHPRESHFTQADLQTMGFGYYHPPIGALP